MVYFFCAKKIKLLALEIERVLFRCGCVSPFLPGPAGQVHAARKTSQVSAIPWPLCRASSSSLKVRLMPWRIFYFQIPRSLACLCYPFEKELMGFQLSYNDVLIFSRRYHEVVVQLEEIHLWQITEICWPVKRRNASHGSVELKITLILNTIFIIPLDGSSSRINKA